AGIIGFTKSVAKEVASRNVLVNAVAPGYVETELTRGITPEAKKYFLDNIPLGRLGQGTDIAYAVLFPAYDLARYITGQVLVVDGGMVVCDHLPSLRVTHGNGHEEVHVEGQRHYRLMTKILARQRD